MSYKLVHRAIWADLDLSTAERFTLVVISDFVSATDETREAWPSVSTISDLTGLGVRTVRRSLRRLEEAGLIETELRYRDNGSKTSSLYTVNIPDYTVRTHREKHVEGRDGDFAPRHSVTTPATVAAPHRPERPDPSATVADPEQRSSTKKKEPLTKDSVETTHSKPPHKPRTRQERLEDPNGPEGRREIPVLSPDVVDAWEAITGKWPTVYQRSELLTLVRMLGDPGGVIEEMRAAADHGTQDMDIIRRRVEARAKGEPWSGATHPGRRELEGGGGEYDPLAGRGKVIQ